MRNLKATLDLSNSLLCVRRSCLKRGTLEKFKHEMKLAGVRGLTISPEDSDKFYFKLQDKAPWRKEFEQQVVNLINWYVSTIDVKVISLNFD